ncbi:MAG: methyl-accepting chemotaxis protein [Cellvibrionaceae bacterium]|jgi:methyl-accepting chemotaxis protein
MSFSLRQSLLIGFGIILTLFILTSLYVSYETRKIHTLEDRLLNLRFPTVLTGEKLLDGIDLSLASLRGYMILGSNPAKADKMKAERATAWTKIDQMLKDYEHLSPSWTDTRNVERLANINKLIEAFRQAQQRVEDVAHTPANIESINLLLTQAAPAAGKVIAAITEMIDIESTLTATPERKAALKLMADSRGSFALGSANIRAYLLSGDLKFKRDFDKKWATNEERLKQLSQRETLFFGTQQSAWNNYKTSRATFSSLPQKMFSLRSQEDWNKANYWLATEAEPAAGGIKKLLAELNDSQEKSSQKDTESLLAEEQHLTLVSGLMSAISVISGIGIAIYLSQTISVQLKLMVANAEEMAEGNLVIPTLTPGKISDFNLLSNALNNTRDKLNQLVSRVVSSSENLQQHSGQLKSLIAESEQAVELQQQETDMIATAMNEMSATVREVAQNTSDAAMSAEDADKSTMSGQSIVEETVESINELARAIDHAANTINKLSDETNDVDTILVSISGIADQTNLLALNAAIEAARAGEQGRGFAVVADEVRTLAARTQESTSEIRTMLDHLKTGANNAVKVMGVGHKQAQASVEKANIAKETLQHITETVNVIRDMNTQIATAAEEQSAVTEEMSRNITSINTGSHNIVEQSHASLQSANEMAGMASQLAESVAQFKINRNSSGNA